MPVKGGPSVGIIGAGIAGLAAAIELSHSGVNVTVIESASKPGGKLREVNVGGAQIDAGPTVFTMRWVFEELFEKAGHSFQSHVSLMPLEMQARHAWNEKARLDLWSDPARSADSIGAFSGAAEARGFLAFSERARSAYQALENTFIRASRPSLPGLIARSAATGLPGIRGLLQISPFTSLAQELDKHFRDPRLKQLFGRYATYCGSSPFDAPATLMLVAHVEQQGVWVIQGGMYCLALAMEKIARAQGVRFRYDTEAREILLKRTTVSGLRCNTTGRDEVLEFDAVIANTDANAVANGALGAALRNATATVPEAARSLSAVTWMLSTKASGFPLHRHNVFFSRDYRREFNDIFDSRRLPNEPTVYVCAQDRDEQGQTTTIHERFLILINAPPTGDVPQNPAFSPEEIHRCEETIFKLLGRCGLRMEPTAPAMVTTPTEWHQLFPETGGALYGRASHGWMASFRRPAARTKIPGLYLAGGSVHPGPGMAMAALSGRQAAKAVLTDQRSTRSWHAMATYGGT